MSHWRALQDSCLHGHPFPENLRIDKRGWAVCRTCQRAACVPAGAGPDDVDPVAVQRAVSGHPPDCLTVQERAWAIRHLTCRGYSARQIAARIRCSMRTVYRVRSASSLEEPVS